MRIRPRLIQLVIGVATVSVCLCRGASSETLEEARNRLKEKYGFAQWAGKRGRFIEGYKLDWQRYPEVAGLKVSEETYAVSPRERIVARSLDLQGVGGTAVRLAINLGMRSTDDVHEELMDVLMSQPSSTMLRADTRGMPLGDIGFFQDGPGGSVYVVFVRNNILISVTRMSDRSRVDLLRLAKRIDDELLALPVLDTLETSSALPVFRRIAVPSTAKAGTFVDFQLHATSRDGGKVVFQVKGASVSVFGGKRMLGIPSESFTLRIFAISESNLYSEAERKVIVTE